MIAFDCRLRRPDFVFDAAFEAGAGVTALFGPSGCGKSTAIRLLAGLERPDDGRIVVGSDVLVDTAARRFAPPHRRRMGLVFQDAHLLPHLTVRRNLLYGAFFAAPGDRRIAFDPVVEVLGIAHLLRRLPATLSGGERQRVAIGRALLSSPRVLLMDEPMASLDAARKQEILPYIERLRDEFAIPIVYVSHAVDEVARLADKVVRLAEGRVVAEGGAGAALDAGIGSEDPSGILSILTATVGPDATVHGLDRMIHPAGDIYVRHAGVAGRIVRVVIRASDVVVAKGPQGATSIRTRLHGRVAAIRPVDDAFALVTIELIGGEAVRAAITWLSVAEIGLVPGDEVQALVKTAALAGL